jgi:protein TonB
MVARSSQDTGGIMLRVLLESRARRQQRAGGMALSFAVHLAIIGAVTATTVHASRPLRDPIVVIPLAPPARPAPPTPPEPRHRALGHAPSHAPTIVVDRIPIPIDIPNTLPSIDHLPSPTPNYETAGIGAPTGSATGPRSIIDGEGASENTDWRGNELLMRIVTSATPRYPESLRQAGVDGRVLVRFVVDTLGSVDMNSVQVLESTHDLFTRAVRAVLGNLRFKPAESRGHRVRAMAEMPFEFQIRK